MDFASSTVDSVSSSVHYVSDLLVRLCFVLLPCEGPVSSGLRVV